MTSKTRLSKIRAKLPYFPNQVKKKNERKMIGYSTPHRPTPLLQFYKAVSSIYMMKIALVKENSEKSTPLQDMSHLSTVKKTYKTKPRS